MLHKFFLAVTLAALGIMLLGLYLSDPKLTQSGFALLVLFALVLNIGGKEHRTRRGRRLKDTSRPLND